MKKLLLFSASAVFIFGNSIAQNAIPNPGFEAWTNHGGYDDPSNGWGTIADISGGFVVTCYKATAAADVHSGAAAIKLQTKNIPLQGEAPGICVTGTINQQTQGVDGGVAFNLRPDSLTGLYKYSPVGTDTASVDIRLSYWNGTRVQIAQARFEKTTAAASYARFSVPFVYALPNTPDTIVIVLMSSSGAATTANTNSTAYYDDLDLVYNGTGVNEQSANSSISVYPNPTSSAITFSTEMQKFTVKVLDAAGRIILNEESDASSYRMNVSNLSSGIYFYELTTSNAAQTQRGKFAVGK